MKSAGSPFYPPRAGRGHRFYKGLDGGRSWLNRTTWGYQLSAVLPTGFLGNCLIPGFGFRGEGRERLVRAGLISWLVGFTVYFLWVGRGVSTFAFIFMLSIHASSILCAICSVWPQRLLLIRMLMAITIVIVLSQFAYAPALRLLERSALMPIWFQGGLYVINRTPWGQDLHRGDLVAYRIEPQSGLARVQEGIGLDTIIGKQGDVLQFTATDLRINGRSHPKRDGMPSSGQLVVPAGYWFVWPTLRTVVMGNVAASLAPQARVDIGTIAQDDILGKPFGFRLWRHQDQ